MARNTQQTCRSIMARMRQQGLEDTATELSIVTTIHEVAGSTHDTREKYLRELKQRRFISKREGVGYTLHHESAEGDDDTSMLAEISGRLNAQDARITALEETQ